jgi:hypothetical protein
MKRMFEFPGVFKASQASLYIDCTPRAKGRATKACDHLGVACRGRRDIMSLMLQRHDNKRYAQ